MVNLDSDERLFVEQRSRLARRWPIIGVILMAVVSAMATWLWISAPFLINPWAVVAGLRAEAIPDSTLVLMAGMLPLVTLACLALLLFIPLVAFAAFSNELKLMAIISRLTESDRGDRSSGTEE